MATLARFKKSEVLVTGGRGYVGSHVASLIDATILDLEDGWSLDSFDAKDVKYRNLKVIIHLADRRLDEISTENFSLNVEMHKKFIQKVADLPRLEKFIFSSSCSVYGFSEDLISEDSPVQPTSHYAESKLATEEILRQTQIPSLVIRFGTAYGMSERMRPDLLVNQFARAAARAEELEVYAPAAWRPYVHCRDFARFLVQQSETAEFGLRNAVTENLSKQDILNSAPVQASELKYRFVNRGDPRNYRVRVHEDLAKGSLSVSQGLEEMMRYYRES